MIKKTLIIANLFFALALVAVHFSAFINPLDFWLFAFFGLGYPLLLFVSLIFLFIWLFTSNKYLSLISIIALIISFKSNIATIQLSVGAQNINEVSIMSWNVKNFDLYNWTGNLETRNKMFKLLKENRPKILCLQEFYTEDKGKFNNLKDLKKELGYKYVYFAKTYSQNKTEHWGLAIFSDYKILNEGKLTFVEGTRLNSCMYADIALNKNQNVRVYNVHLQSNQFSQEDYKFLENIGGNSENDKKSASKIFAKLKKGYINRAKQTKKVYDSKTDSPYPSIICGDFNDTPVSFAYHTLSEGMYDAFIEKGNGLGKTFANPTPFLRIDYLLFNKIFKVNEYKTYNNEVLSDHYPISAKFTF